MSEDFNEKAPSSQAVKVLSANDIFDVEDISIVPVDVPEWKGMVYVKGMTALERERYFESIKRTVGKGRKTRESVVLERSSAILVAMCACDAQGNRIFSREDVPRLAAKSSRALQRITDAAAKLNGLDDDEEVIEERKNE